MYNSVIGTCFFIRTYLQGVRKVCDTIQCLDPSSLSFWGPAAAWSNRPQNSWFKKYDYRFETTKTSKITSIGFLIRNYKLLKFFEKSDL